MKNMDCFSPEDPGAKEGQERGQVPTPSHNHQDSVVPGELHPTPGATVPQAAFFLTHGYGLAGRGM